MAKVGVVLSGCGVFDGAEIHESVLTLLALARAGAETVCMAPDIEQAEVINHLSGEKKDEKRNVLEESARIARGQISNIKEVRAADLDALIFPGGFGAAKNLCTFAFQGTECVVDAEVARLAREVHAEGKPIGAACIAPAMMAKIFEGQNAALTIGNDAEVAGAMTVLGARHVECPVREITVDAEKKFVSTPAYMLAGNIVEAAEGIENMVKEVLQLVKTGAAS